MVLLSHALSIWFDLIFFLDICIVSIFVFRSKHRTYKHRIELVFTEYQYKSTTDKEASFTKAANISQPV